MMAAPCRSWARPGLSQISRTRGLACARSPDLRPPSAPLIPRRTKDLAGPTQLPIHQAKSLHPAFYTDPEIVEAERERIFGSHWFVAAHTAELATPGDVKLVDVGKNSIILTCDRHRKIHAFYNVCRHRGAKVASRNEKGCKQLVCPYHWWAYRLDGSLKASPPAVLTEERKQELGLLPVPGLETFAGLVFLNQQPNPPPLSSSLGDLPTKLARYDLDHLELHGHKAYDIQGDWKLVAENFIDYYHIDAVHPELRNFSQIDNHYPYQGPGQYVGFVTSPLTDCGGAGDLVNFNIFPGLRKVEQTAALFFQIFPNASITIYPHSVYSLITFPHQQPGRTLEQLTLLMAPGAKKSGDSAEQHYEKCEKLLKFACNINDEDVVAIENLYSGLKTGSMRGVYGELIPKYDWTIHRFQNMALGAVDGSPIDEGIMPSFQDDFAPSVAASP